MTLNEQQLKHINAWQASGSTQTAYCQKTRAEQKDFFRMACKSHCIVQAHRTGADGN